MSSFDFSNINLLTYIYHCHLNTVYLYANKVPNDYKEYLFVYFSQLILNNIALLLFSGMLLPFVNSRKPFMRVFCLIDCRAVTLHFFVRNRPFLLISDTTDIIYLVYSNKNMNNKISIVSEVNKN